MPDVFANSVQSTWKAVLRALRPHQWAKNLLVFVPLVLAQRFDVDAFRRCAMALVAFSACASAVYLLNDIVDIAADRDHPRKRLRPIASGAVSQRGATMLAGTLFLVSVAVAFMAEPRCVFLLVLYVVGNVLYSTWLKREPIVDVIALSGMYGLRLETGAVAAGVPLSPWLLAFSLFFFTSLAFAKRYVELRQGDSSAARAISGRGYVVGDADLLASLGPASGYVAVLVLALYMNSEQMRSIYGEGTGLWVLCPLVLYWISRVWLLARRGDLNEDPVVFALTDRSSMVVAGLAAIVLFVATMCGKVAW